MLTTLSWTLGLRLLGSALPTLRWATLRGALSRLPTQGRLTGTDRTRSSGSTLRRLALHRGTLAGTTDGRATWGART